mgnify:CR=1 FL=1|jgi:hypothetical protein
MSAPVNTFLINDGINSNLPIPPMSFIVFFKNTILGPDHSIRESMLIIATLIGYFNHMKNKTKTPSHIWIYLFCFMILPAYLISYKTW